jgi:hypothetical protein
MVSCLPGAHPSFVLNGDNQRRALSLQSLLATLLERPRVMHVNLSSSCRSPAAIWQA